MCMLMMTFQIDVNYNGEHLIVNGLEKNGFGYIEMLNDTCGALGGEWLGQLVSLKGVHPYSGNMFLIERDEDVQILLQLYLSTGRTTINVNLKLQTCASQLSQTTQTKTGQTTPESDGSDGGEVFYWSDSSADDDSRVGHVVEDSVTDENNDSLSDYDSDNAKHCKGIDDEDETGDRVEKSMSQVADKMQGDYFKKVLDEDKETWKIVFKKGQIFDNVYHLRKILHEYCMQEGVKLKKKANDKSKVTAKCNAEGCSFRLHASTYVHE